MQWINPIKYIGVLRDTARAPQPQKPTGHQMNRQGLYVLKKAYFGPSLAFLGPKIPICPYLPIFGHKCQFWAKFGRFWAKNPNF